MSDDRRHDPALELLRDLDPKAMLSPQARRRIAHRIDGVPRSWSRWLWLAAPCAAALALLMMRMTRQSPTPASRSDVTQAFVVPACAVTRVADGARFAAALVGPADAQVGSMNRQNVSLHAGRFIVRTKQQPVEVEGPDTRVTISPSSFAEIEVRELHTVRVAVYSGRASVEITTLESTFTIAAGDSWNGGEVHRTEVHDSARATQILDPATGSVQLCPAPANDSATVAPPVTVPSPPKSTSAKGSAARPTPPELPTHSMALAEPIAASGSAANEVPSTAEARQLVEAIRCLRSDHDARRALALLDTVQRPGAASTFTDEIALVRIEALLDIGDRRAALAALDSLSLPDVPRGEELVVLRGDLRAEAKRWSAAIVDYTSGTVSATSQLVERSLFGRANCRLAAGELSLARSDLRDYLQRFPDGRFSADARRLLAR
jgi:hypothetical protein